MSRRPNPTGRPARQARARRLILEPLEGRNLLTLYTVTTAADSGSGSLRAEITLANANTSTLGPNSIQFMIANSGVQTIALQSPLPSIINPVVIDGSEEPGFLPNSTPIVVLDGSGAGAGANGLKIAAGGGGSTIRGLSIVGFTPVLGGGGGEGIFLSGSGTAGGNSVFDDYIGVEPDGLTPKANGSGVLVFSPNNTIGGTTPLTANVISGNQYAGVLINGTAATANLVTGNLLGLASDGMTAVGSQSSVGISQQYGVVVAAPSNTIGGTAPGAGNVISGNVGPNRSTLLGPIGSGILFEGQAPGNLVLGNSIGTNAAGNAAAILPGFGSSITYSNVYGINFGTPGGSSSDNLVQETIGGSVAGAGNLISGNIYGITGSVASSVIQGNTVGLNLAGSAAIPNGDGIFLDATQTTIGGATLAARNIISGSSPTVGVGLTTGAGLSLSGDSDVVEGNFVGTASSGLATPGTGNVDGMDLTVTNSTIGSTTLGDGNIVSGNSGNGIALSGNGGDVFYGNAIGLDFQSQPDGNGGSGIIIEGPTSVPPTPFAVNVSIGGTAPGQGNLIAHNTGSGVFVSAAPGSFTGLGIRGDTIFANGFLGIVATNQNPGTPTPSTLFVNGATLANGQVTVTGVYFDAPGTTVAIDLFANSADPSGYGQGPISLGPVSATTNASGFAAFSASFAAPATPYTSLSATYTGPSGNTSEFTANYPTVAGASVADLRLTASAASTSVTVNDTITLVETITNYGPNTAGNVLFYDTLPTTFQNAMVLSSQGTASFNPANNVFAASLGSLAAGASATVTITGMPSQSGVVVDQPGASSTTFDPNYANNIAQQTIIVAPMSTGPSADLAIIQSTSPATARVGSPLTYTITVSNKGPNPSTNATVIDTVPIGLTIDSVTATQEFAAPVINGNFVILNLGTIADLGLATVTIVATPSAAGSVTNLATVSGTEFDPVFANNRSTLTTAVAAAPSINLFLAQIPAATTGAIGQPLTINMVFENFGPNAATNVTLLDSLPANVTYSTSATSQGGPASFVNGQLRVNFGTLAAGAVARFQLIVIPRAIGPATNVVALFSPDLPSIAPFVNGTTVPIVAGPSVSSINGMGGNALIVLTFNEALNPTTAINPANYQLVALGKSGKGPPLTIRIASVTYNQVSHSVMILPAQAIDPTQNYRITLIGATSSGIADTLGRRLASTLYGPAGNNFAATFFAGTLPQI